MGVTPRPSPVLLGSSNCCVFPSTTVVPDTFEANGSTWTTCEAYSGAQRQATTISTSRTNEAIAALLRTSWPSAVRHGPAEPRTAGSTAWVPGAVVAPVTSRAPLTSGSLHPQLTDQHVELLAE